jgi:DNA-binding NarL/FixJ family response regulator
MPIRVLVIDDHAVVRAGLRAVLDAKSDMEVIGEAASGALAIRLARKLRPDVIVTDLLLPDMDGVALTQSVRADLPDTHVVILTGVSDEDASLVRAIQAGAIGYVLKSAQINVLLETIRSAAQGQVHLSARATARLIQAVRSPRDHMPLSERELEVLRKMAVGRTNKEIAQSLQIAESTVKSHVRAILEKLDVQSRTEAAFRALRSDVLSPSELQAA